MTIGQQLDSRSSTTIETSWREDANCRFTDPALFFPAGITGAAVEEIEGAKEVCQGCRVKAACLEFALETNQEAGIWGGTTEDERRKIRRAWLAGRRRRQNRVTA